MAGKVRNHTGMKSGGITLPPNHVAFVPEHPQDRGKKGNTSRVSRVGSTARPTGSGSAGASR